MLAVEKRFAPSTRGQDRSYWRMWAEWCDSIGTPPLRTNSAASAVGSRTVLDSSGVHGHV
jgi:hypothetical protein